MYDTAIVIGRFQPVHHGHLALLHMALARARQVVVILGSAHQARTPKNPFTWSEREAMLRAALPADDAARLTVLPIADHYDEAAWARAVCQAVARHSAAGDRIALVGHFKDASSSYLNAFKHWELLEMPQHAGADATTIRNAWFAKAPLPGDLPPNIRAALEQFTRTPAFASLQEEWQMLRNYHASWATAPYPPVFVTVDAVVRCQGHILLIRRAHPPGKDLLAVPGGFIEQHETLWQACLRELAEETRLALPEATWRAALRHVTVFDHPGRSQRGRTITHAHYFDLGDRPLPEICAADDAAQAQWLPTAALAHLQACFFEDHFHLLGRFVPLSAHS